MLRGGGRAWPKIPRDFSTKLNRKVRQMGMRVALSAKLREYNLEVVPSIRKWTSAKTGDLHRRLRTKGWATGETDKTLLVVGGDVVPRHLDLSTRNLRNVHVVLAKDLGVYDALWWKRLILDLDAVDYFISTLGKDNQKASSSSYESNFPSTAGTGTHCLGLSLGSNASLLPLHYYIPLYAATAQR